MFDKFGQHHLEAIAFNDRNFRVPADAEPEIVQTDLEKKKNLPKRKVFRATWVERSKWSGEQLRAIRRRNGVGSAKRREDVRRPRAWEVGA